MKKKVLLAVLAAALCVSMAACGNTNSPAPESKGTMSDTSQKGSKANTSGEYGIVTSSASLQNVGLEDSFGVLPVPRTAYDLYVNVGDSDSYYKLAMNTNEWLFPKELKPIDDVVNNISSTAEFFAADTDSQLYSVSVAITDQREDAAAPSDTTVKHEYNGWDFVVYDGTNAKGYYPLEDGYYLEASLPGVYKSKQLGENAYQSFMEAFSKNIAVEKLNTTGGNKIVLPARFSNFKINDKFSLNLVDSVSLERWVTTSEQNGIRVVTEAKETPSIFEYPDGITMEMQKESLGDSFSFKTHDYHGIKLELVYWARNLDTFASDDSKGKCAGFLMEIDGRIYQIDQITPVAVDTDEALNAYLDGIFTNLILYKE